MLMFLKCTHVLNMAFLNFFQCHRWLILLLVSMRINAALAQEYANGEYNEDERSRMSINECNVSQQSISKIIHKKFLPVNVFGKQGVDLAVPCKL